MKLYELVQGNYSTYRNVATGKAEKHIWRLTWMLLLSIFLALFSDNASLAYPALVTGITILTGFTFGALFSGQLMADADLPKAADESDRNDLSKLSTLAENFRSRSRYFIAISIINITLLILLSLDYSLPQFFSEQLRNQFATYDWYAVMTDPAKIQSFRAVISDTVFALTVFLFLEGLYTFYRLSETIVAVLDTRSEYLKAARDRPA